MNLHRLARPRKAPRTKPRNPDRVVSDGHLKWLRGRDCCVADADFGPGAIGCSGRIQAHHVRTAANSGTGLKPGDDKAVSICERHHMQLDSVNCGPKSFEKMYCVNLLELAAEYWAADTYHRMKYERAQEDVR